MLIHEKEQLKSKKRIKNEKIMIIGAGPIGCYCGYLLARKGYQVDIFEEHEEIGNPVGCTGIVTKDLEKFIKVNKDFLVNKISKAELFCKNISTEINLQEYIIDRERFDKYIAKLAKKAGAKIYLNHKVLALKNNEIIIKKIKSKKIIKLQIKEYKHIVGADGPQSLVTRKINNKLLCNNKMTDTDNKNVHSDSSKIRYYIGKQAIIEGDFDEEKFLVHFGSICPHFFGWVVPENKKIARVGIAVLKDPNRYFDDYLTNLRQNQKNKIRIGKIIKIQSGLIPIYNPKIKTYVQEKTKNRTTNYYIVGDAALQVKATTGGGLIPGFKAAKALARSIIKKENYQKTLFKIRAELRTHLIIRNLLNKFKDNDYCELLAIVEKPSVKKILAKHSRDSVISMIIKLLIKEPKLVIFALKAFK